MKTLTLNERIDMGNEAGKLKDNPAFSYALEVLRESCYERLQAAPLKDTEGLTLIAQQLKVVNAFEAAVSGLVEGGKAAAHDWENLKARRDGFTERTLRRVL
mgnify:CR=1 FL=1